MKTRIHTVLPVMLCVLCLAGCGKGKETEEKQLALKSQGMAQALEGDYAAAIDSYDRALSLSDMHVGALELDIAAYKASAQYHAGQTAAAIDTCTAVLDLKKSAELYMTRGILYREDGNTQAAGEDFAAAIKLTSSKDHVMLGRLYYYMEDYTKAKEHLEQVASGKDNEALYWLGELYWQAGNREYAITLYQSYLEGEARHQSAYAKVAAWQMEQDDYDAALATLENGIAKGDGSSLQALLGYEIAVYEHKGDFETAKLKTESYLESYPEDEAAAREYEFLKSR